MPEAAVTTVEPHEQVLLVRIHKRSLDEASANQLLDDVLAAAAARPRVPIVLDMAAVKFAPSVAIGALIQLRRSLQFEQRRLVLVALDRRVYETLVVTNLHSVLEIQDNLDQVVV